MKKAIFFIAILLLLPMAFAEWDFNKTIPIKPKVNIVIDSNANKFWVTVGSVSNQYLCTSDQNSTFDWESTYTIGRNDLNLNDIFNPLIQVFDSNKTTYLTALSDQIDRIKKMNESCDINAFKQEIIGFKNAIDASMSERLGGFDAKITNTFMPKQAELEALKTEKSNLQEGQRKCLSDYNVLGIASETQKRLYEIESENKNNLLGLMSLALIILLITLVVTLIALGGIETLRKQKALKKIEGE